MDTDDVEFEDELDEQDEEMDDQNEYDLTEQNGAENESSSSEEDESSNEFDDKLEIELKNVYDAISLNRNDYDSYLKLIELCRTAADSRPDELSSARERMSEIFPLSIELWLSWLRDEKERAINDKNEKNNQEINKENNQRILSLFERAILDYVSVDIWVEYQSFILNLIIEGENVDLIKIYERALSSVGQHPTQGHRVYEIYRSYLLEIGDETQLDSVFKLFQRQISIPSINLEDTYNKFQELVSNSGKEPPFDRSLFENTYKRSKEQFEKLKPFEDKLKTSPSLENYYEYLDYEIKQNNPSRVQFLFERAIADQTHCLSSELWMKYLRYLQDKLNIQEVIIPVLKRAIRNVVNCSEIWIEYICTIERFDRSEQEAQEVFEKSLESMFYNEEDYRKIWLCYLEYRRRKTDFNDSKQVQILRENFKVCIDHLTKMYCADPNFEVSIYQAFVEAKFCSNMPKSREIWKEIMKSHQSMGIRQVDYWVEYATLEKLYGCKEDFRTYKEVMLKALNHCPESFDLLSYQLIRHFKLESNDIKEIDAVEKSVLNIFERVIKVYRAKQEEMGKGVKRKEHPASVKPILKDNKKFKKELDPESSKQIQKPAVEFKKPFSDENNLNTVVVKNLDFKLDENKIKEEFKKFGNIKEVRLVKKFDGKSKGYCFIEYSSQEEARNAISNDNMLIGKRKTFISALNEDPKFKYETGLEKNKLFVSKLPPKLTQKELTEFFRKFEGFREARLNTYRNGNSKGSAYIEFKNDEDASRALDKTKDTKVGEISRKFSVNEQFKKISVALSNPPQKRNEDTLVDSKMLGDGMFKKPISFGRAKPKLQL